MPLPQTVHRNHSGRQSRGERQSERRQAKRARGRAKAAAKAPTIDPAPAVGRAESASYSEGLCARACGPSKLFCGIPSRLAALNGGIWHSAEVELPELFYYLGYR